MSVIIQEQGHSIMLASEGGTPALPDRRLEAFPDGTPGTQPAAAARLATVAAAGYLTWTCFST